MGDELAKRAAAPLARQPTAMEILAQATQQGLDPAGLETLAKLAWQQEERNAAREFAAGLAEFHRRVPEILKSKTAHVTTKSGASYRYQYAPLEMIDRIVKPILQELGFSYSWDSVTDGQMMTVVCRLRHINGHEERASFACPTTSTSPGMGDAQKAASAMSFARRQSLTAILGLTTTEPDSDGADPTTITESQAADLEALADEVGADKGRLLRYAGVERFGDILASRYGELVRLLEAKRRKS